jgi:hypothetical protein
MPDNDQQESAEIQGKETTEAAPRSFWMTLPGILSGTAGVITAVGGLLAVLVSAGVLRFGAEPTAAPVTARPRVVSTTPANGATDVDPALAEIKVVFRQPMKTGSWSIVKLEAGQPPEMTGNPYFLDAQTCVVPVRLDPGVEYRIGINSPTHQGFVSARDETLRAEPYVLSFSTAP